MGKKRICICLDEELHKKSKLLNLNLSSFIDLKLREYLTLIEGNRNE